MGEHEVLTLPPLGVWIFYHSIVYFNIFSSSVSILVITSAALKGRRLPSQMFYSWQLDQNVVHQQRNLI